MFHSLYSSSFQLETRAISHISVLLLLIQRRCTQPVELFSLQSLFATRHARLSYTYVNYDVFGRSYGNFISTCLINVLLLAQTLLSLLPSIYALTKSRLCSWLIMRSLFFFSFSPRESETFVTVTFTCISATTLALITLSSESSQSTVFNYCVSVRSISFSLSLSLLLSVCFWVAT